MLVKLLFEAIKYVLKEIIDSDDIVEFSLNIILLVGLIIFEILALIVDLILLPFELIILIMWLIKEKIFD